MASVKIEVRNSKKQGPIYTCVCDLYFDSDKNDYFVERRGKEIGVASTKTMALVTACEHILKGFNEPGVYTAWVDDAPYVNREVRDKSRAR